MYWHKLYCELIQRYTIKINNVNYITKAMRFNSLLFHSFVCKYVPEFITFLEKETKFVTAKLDNS